MKTRDTFILGLRFVRRYGGGVLPLLQPITALLAYHVRLKGIRFYFLIPSPVSHLVRPA